MKNKKNIIIIIVCIVIALVLIACWFLLRLESKKSYIIKEWSNFTQTISIDIEDESIISVTQKDDPDAQLGTLTGGENTLFVITGLKEGDTIATVNIINSDGSIESSKLYYFEINNSLDVNLQKIEEFDIQNSLDNNYVIREWSNLSQNIKISINDESIVKVTKNIESNIEMDSGGMHTLFTIIGLKKGNVTARIDVYNSDGTTEITKIYYFKVSDNLKVNLIKIENIK